MQSTSDLTSRLAAIIQELTAPQVVEVKAAQTGHSGKVLLEVYSRWLPGVDGGRQKALMEAVFGKQEERKVG